MTRRSRSESRNPIITFSRIIPEGASGRTSRKTYDGIYHSSSCNYCCFYLCYTIGYVFRLSSNNNHKSK